MSKENRNIRSTAEDAGKATEDVKSKQRVLREETKRTSASIVEQGRTASASGEAVRSDIRQTTDAIRDQEAVSSAANETIRDDVRRTSKEVKQIGIVTQLTAIMAFREGISSMTSGLIQLGIVGEEDAKTLMKVNAAFSMMAGAVGIIKAIQGAMTVLNLSTLKNAMLNTYNAVVSNPGKAALVGVGLGAAAGAVSYFALNQSTQTHNTSISIEGGTPSGQAATAEKIDVVYRMTGAGDYA